MNNIEDTRPVFVIGHKNPDTDSICAAITYANLKNKAFGGNYIACRAGHLNEETQFVLSHFGVDVPAYIKDVRTQVRDMEIRRLDGVTSDLSLKNAWAKMRDADVVTLCATEGDKLTGIVTTNDIVETYMDVIDPHILSQAKTSYKNIVETLDGELIVGNIEDSLESGKVVIAAASPEMMENVIEKGDIVILGNRYETQLCAIELEASCIIVCEGAEVTRTIKSQATEHGTRIITTPHDTFVVARLINQSMPIDYIMKKDNLATFYMDDFIEDIQEVMASMRHRYFPVLDKNDNYIGMISRRNFLGAHKKQMILVDHNEKNQAVNGADSADILEIIDHHRLRTIETSGPVFFRNQPLGSTCTIIYLMYKEYGVEIDPKTAGLLLAAILSDTLMFRSPTCTQVDRNAGEELSKIAQIDYEEFAKEMFHAGSNLSGKSASEILHQDFKKFTVDDLTIGIGQINSMSSEELVEIKSRIEPELKSVTGDDGLDMIFFMLTNIIDESSEIIFSGNKALHTINSAFGLSAEGNSVVLPGVVSRKKQLLPAIVEAMQQ
ncbi:MAG: putative manganese-dependent inorganic diphosphatase [Butyrivibrio sp.]|uniref:putative manganese-dependent inorganic diphosphatase n=1 Tax=Butyrivibrio sp. TaxID=28121 RepID=UPI001B4F4B4E|nr:putative manganese-dependent inorganic diphosphatase [Butyrivibrio sp.]MBP3782371.1 putative manganese-dependent inorganic diphosphatase [Butyrivibrio sp.]MBP3813447.1 putative manganese-dependent inorganic diphosphatase [Butyrivibrio sp.]